MTTASDKKALLEKYAASFPDSPFKNHYVSYARNFLDYADGLDKESVNRYLARLRRQGKAAGTINFAFGVIRRLFVVNKLDWDFRRGEAPQVRQREIKKPALDPELIKLTLPTNKFGGFSGYGARHLKALPEP